MENVRICLLYIDDIVILTNNFAKHLEHLENAFSVLEDKGTHLKLKEGFLIYFKEETLIRLFALVHGGRGLTSNSQYSSGDLAHPQWLERAPSRARGSISTENYPYVECPWSRDAFRRVVNDFTVLSTPLKWMLKKTSEVDENEEFFLNDGQQKAFVTIKDSLPHISSCSMVS